MLVGLGGCFSVCQFEPKMDTPGIKVLRVTRSIFFYLLEIRKCLFYENENY